MLRTVNVTKMKQLKPHMRGIAVTALWLVLVGVALAFIAIAGHI